MSMDTAQFRLRGKTITIDKELYDEMRDRFFTFDEDDCKYFLRAMLTEGSLDNGFSYPDIDAIIDAYPADKLSALISEGAGLQRKMMA